MTAATNHLPKRENNDKASARLEERHGGKAYTSEDDHNSASMVAKHPPDKKHHGKPLEKHDGKASATNHYQRSMTAKRPPRITIHTTRGKAI
jgi:hypothetical protein